MRSSDHPYIQLLIGPSDLSKVEQPQVISVMLSRMSSSSGQTASIIVYDPTGYDIENILLNENTVVTLQYGWSEGSDSPVYEMQVISYSSEFISSEGDSRITIECVAKSILSNSKSSTITYEDKNIDEIIKIIASRNGWGIGNIEPTKEVYEDNSSTDKVIFSQSNQTDEEFISKVLIPKSVSKINGKGDYIFKLVENDGSVVVYYEPKLKSESRVLYNAVNSSPIKNLINNNLSPSQLFLNSHRVNKPEGPTIDGLPESSVVGNSYQSDVLELSYVVGSVHDDRVLSYSSTYSGALAYNTLGDAISTEYQDKWSNEYEVTVVGKRGEHSVVTPAVSSNGKSSYTSPSTSYSTKSKNELFIESIVSQEGKKYVSGSAGPSTFDCSGLVSYGMIKSGYASPGFRVTTRSISSFEGTYFKRINDIKDLRPGDILVSDSHMEVFISNSQVFGAHSPSQGIGYQDTFWHLKNMNYHSFYRVIDNKNPVTSAGALVGSVGSVGKLSKSLNKNSGTPSSMELESVNTFDRIQNSGWELTLEVIGDPTIIPRSIVDLVVYTKSGKEHFSSGRYIISSIDDNLQGSSFTTILKLLPESSPELYSNTYLQNGQDPSSYNINPMNSTEIKTSHDQFKEPKSYGNNRVIYYAQTDEVWNKDSSLNISGSGCGPTSLAMVLSTLTGRSITPVEVARYAKSKGYYHKDRGSDSSKYFYELADQYNINAVKVTEWNTLMDYLKKGYIGITNYKKGYWTTWGHFVTVCGLDSNGRMLINDPASRNKSRKAHGYDTAHSSWHHSVIFIPKFNNRVKLDRSKFINSNL